MTTLELLHKLCVRWPTYGGPPSMLQKRVDVGTLLVILEEVGVIKREGLTEYRCSSCHEPPPDGIEVRRGDICGRIVAGTADRACGGRFLLCDVRSAELLCDVCGRAPTRGLADHDGPQCQRWPCSGQYRRA